ncbi:hypothetical protein TMO_1112 [Tistrella mobilis KA081020-065]|uniref:Uncharacterized protein n=1 Tax=Tistrella mobilis (strain KA081020-065) TaxID=1110502 RepID=I3TJL3_TISMK|nr:hypothetical protein TMO_1112 [Tistrella mobilis KA081020-065]
MSALSLVRGMAVTPGAEGLIEQYDRSSQAVKQLRHRGRFLG